MSTINLSNPRLREYVRNTIGINKFNEPFRTMIEEIFIREQYVLSLTPTEFYEDLWNFANSVKNIEFGQIPSKNILGYYDPANKSIVLNYNYWQKVKNTNKPIEYCKRLFETVSHECLHGAQAIAGTYKNRAEGYNKNVKNRAHAIYEICTQGIAAKLANNRNVDELEQNAILFGNGYSYEVFAVPLISASFGIPERDVLKYGVRQREKFINVLNKNIGNINETKKLVDELENQLEYIHSINYPDENQEEFINLSPEEKKQLNTKAMLQLISVCQESWVSRIKNTPLNFDKNMAIQYKYDQKKFIDTISQELNKYSHKFDKTPIMTIVKYNSNALYIDKAISVFNQLGKNSKNLMEYAPHLINAVIHGDFGYCKKMGININDEKTFSIVNKANQFKDEKAHIDYNDFYDWDNRKIFEVIYYGHEISSQKNIINSSLNSWQNVYSPEGYKKIEDLRTILTLNKWIYGINSKKYLLDFINTPENEMNSFYYKITKYGHTREYFKRSFRTIQDKEFLTKLIADRYINKSFNLDGTLKNLETQREKDLQAAFMPTIKKYGKEQLEYAICNMLVKDDYQSFSNENCRLTLAIQGKKTIFDIISEPLLEELLKQRKISTEKNNALQKAIYETEIRHPGTSSTRIAALIGEYKQNNNINYQIFSGNGRKEFRNQFKSQKDMEDLIGVLCDTYSKSDIKPETGINNGISYESYVAKMFKEMIQNNGTDRFRENLINAILYNNYSEFINPREINSVKNISTDILIKHLSKPYIKNALIIQEYNKVNNPNFYAVSKEDLAQMSKNQPIKNYNSFIDGLIEKSGKNRDTNRANLFENEK